MRIGVRYYECMRRITISLPDDLAEIIEDEARRLRRPLSEIVREAIAKELGVHPECDLKKKVPFAGIVASEELVSATKMDEYLAGDWPQHLREEMGR